MSQCSDQNCTTKDYSAGIVLIKELFVLSDFEQNGLHLDLKHYQGERSIIKRVYESPEFSLCQMIHSYNKLICCDFKESIFFTVLILLSGQIMTNFL